MSNYIGNEPRYLSSQRDYFTGNGSQTTFTLTSHPGDANGIIVAVSGLLQKPSASYFTSGKTLTFSEAPPAPLPGESNNIEVIYLQRLGSIVSTNWKIPIADNSGTSDAIAATYTPAFGSLVDNMLAYVVLSTTNTTTTPTFSPSGLPAKTIYGFDGAAIKQGALQGTVLLRYEATGDKWVVADNPGTSSDARGTLAGTNVTPNVDLYGSWSWSMTGNSTLNFPTGTIPASGAWYIDITVDATGGYTLTFGGGYNKVYGFYFDCLPNAIYRLWLVSRNSTVVDVNVERLA